MQSKIKNNFLRNSECKGKWLHRFNITEIFDIGVMEVCEICKMKKIFKLVDEQADNLSYMNWHIRSALPPNHPLFYHEFEYEPYNNDMISPYA